MRAEPSLRLTTNLVWERPEPWFGGFSGAEVNADGTRITLLTDRSTFLEANMIRQGGQLTGLKVTQFFRPRHINNTLVKGIFADSEGLAIGANGDIFLSFETATRVVRLNPKTQIMKRLPGHPGFALMANNKGLEALAIHPDGTLYTLAEREPTHRRSFRLYAYAGQKWAITHHIPRRGPFLTVGADFDRDGRFYLLERALTPLGFRSRIRRFDLGAPDLGEETLLTSSAGRFDNLEALSVWQDANGATRLTLISDDNFRAIQRTQILEYILTE